MANTVGMAVVGSAGIIGRQHAAEIVDADGARLVAVTDLDSEVAQQQAAELGARHHHTLEEVLADGEVDAITIATPHPSHHPIALKAFRAGKHVLCEKPIAVTPRQADEIVRGAEEAGVTLGVAYQNRWRPEVREMKRMLDVGAVGEVYHTLLSFPDYRNNAYFKTAPWRGTWEHEGGGVLFNQGVHMLDVFQWVGGMPVSVTGIARTQAHDIEVEDVASALVEYANGGQGMIYCSTVQAPGQFQLEVWGDKGGLVVCDQTLTYYKLESSLKRFTDEGKAFHRPPYTTEPIDIEIRDIRHGYFVE